MLYGAKKNKRPCDFHVSPRRSQHDYHRVFLHLPGHSILNQTYRVSDERQMKPIQARPEKHSDWIRVLTHFQVLPTCYKYVINF